MRWYILGSGDGVVIVNIEDNPKGLPKTSCLRTGGEIVESFVFSSS